MADEPMRVLFQGAMAAAVGALAGFLQNVIQSQGLPSTIDEWRHVAIPAVGTALVAVVFFLARSPLCKSCYPDIPVVPSPPAGPVISVSVSPTEEKK
jgi:hypothetical protein